MDSVESKIEDLPGKHDGLFSKFMRFWIERKLFMALVLGFTLLGGISVAPFDWNISWLPRAPVPVDAIPDIGENQQIVFTTWEGRSPRT